MRAVQQCVSQSVTVIETHCTKDAHLIVIETCCMKAVQQPEKAGSQSVTVIETRCMRVARMTVLETSRMKAVQLSRKTAVSQCVTSIETY